MRRFLIRCISAVYNRRGVKDKPTQAEISKNLKKIKTLKYVSISIVVV